MTKTTAFMTLKEVYQLTVDMNKKAIKELETIHDGLKKYGLNTVEVNLKLINLIEHTEYLQDLIINM